MPNNIGTLVTAPIRVQADGDPISSAYAPEIQGGWHQVSTLVERDAIIPERKLDGMACYVIDVSGAYIWNSSTGWTELVDISGASGVEYVSAPISPTSPGSQGQRSYDSNYLYECIATNTWIRYAAASSW